MTPGKGLRHAACSEVIRSGQSGWSVYAEIASPNLSPLSIGMSAEKRRSLKIDGKFVRSSLQLLKYMRVMWLTPAEDGILNGTKATRRRLLDRLTYNFIPEHVESIVQYEYLLKSRLKLLKQKSTDNLWLHRLELALAQESVKIIANRNIALSRLKEWLSRPHHDFIIPEISMQCEVEKNATFLSENHAQVESISNRLQQNRVLDSATGRSLYGVHRADFIISNHHRKLLAQQSSTGELKMMLISLVIAQIHSLNMHEKIKPILLLDDIFSHIDPIYCHNIIEKLRHIDAQIWITGTQLSHIGDYLKNENFITKHI
jgi:DNA replication and repair protein RecF